MTRKRQFDGPRGERGVALLIAIFALLLISVVGIALIVSSGTDSALARNYRTSTNAYYAALAGMEEARARLLPANANYIPLPVTPMPLTQVVYIINPAGSETVAPDDTGNPLTYPDTQYRQEFGVDVSTRVVTKYNSVSTVAGLPGPYFKWVRINAVTERALGNGGTGVDVNNDGDVDSISPLYFDAENRTVSNVPAPGLIETTNPSYTAQQVLEITAYASLPSGGSKMLQYIVWPMTVFPRLRVWPQDTNVPTFPAALTLAGTRVLYAGPQTNSFYIRGQDQCSTSALPAIGYTVSGDSSSANSGDSSLANISAGAIPAGNYQGAPVAPGPPPAPASAPQSFADVHLVVDSNWLTPTGLDAVVQNITNNADAVITGPTTPNSFPSGMSATHPMTIVVNGDLDMNSWHNTGYGLLLVTGTLHYDPDATWEGVVLVIGQGNFVSTKGGTGGIDGAVFVAKTRDGAGNLLSSLGASSFSQTGPGGVNSNIGRGINYNSCLARAAEGPISYKVIAFKEIPLAN